MPAVPSSAAPGTISARVVLRVVLVVLLVVLALWLIYLLRQPLTWIFIAGFLATALSGPVNWLHRRTGRRGVSIALVYLALILVPVLLAAILSDIGLGLVNSVFAGVTIIVLSLFMIGSGRTWLDWIADRQGPDRADWLKRLYDRIGVAVGNYVAGALGQAVIAGVLAYVVLLILGVPYAGSLAVVIFLLDLVPLVGATLGAILVGIITVFNDFPTTTIIWAIWSVVYQQLENNVIQPRIQARAVSVHPFVVLTSVLFGSTLFGVLGALPAIPVAAAIQIGIIEYNSLRRPENVAAVQAPPEPAE